MDAGTVSSWVAAAISLSSVGGAAAWSWWSRPQIDWLPAGHLRVRDRGDGWFKVVGSVSNFGDGNAHRVSVWIRRAKRYQPDRLATSPLLKPGEALEFEANLHFDCLHEAEMWMTWTPAPIRRRREHMGHRFSVEKTFPPSDRAHEEIQKRRGSQD